MKKSTLLAEIVPAKIVVGLLGGLMLTLIWAAFNFEGNAYPQKPHNVPIAAVGPSPAVDQLAAALQRGDGFRVITSSSEAKALRLVGTRRADAIINLNTHQLQTAQVASTLTPQALEQIFSSPNSRFHLTTTDIKPFAPGDPTPVGLFFLTLGAVLGGLPGGAAFALLSKKRRPDSLADAGIRFGVIAAYSGLQGLLMALIAGDLILGYSGHALVVIWVWGALLCAASMTTTVAGIAAFGPPGLAFSLLPIMDFGVPAAPAPGPWNWEPGLFRVLGPFDPFGATTNALHNGIYFRAASQAQNVEVLAGWILVPLLILVTLGYVAQRRPGSTPDGLPAQLAPSG